MDTVFELPAPNGNPARPVRPPRVPPSIRSARPAGSPLGSCRIGAGLSSQTAALRPPSSSRRSGASRARLPRLVRAGVRSTIGTDSRTVADATQTRECERMAGIGMTDKELQTCNQTAYAAAFGG